MTPKLQIKAAGLALLLVLMAPGSQKGKKR